MPEATVCKLPPLILHPFTDHAGASKLVENSRAGLALHGLAPSEGFSEEELADRVTEARIAEIRMLFYVGKDLFRWIGQCMDAADRVPEWRNRRVREQSFAGLLVHRTPAAVREKLCGWGVADYGLLFSRAMGLYSIFGRPPAPGDLNGEFVLNYHRYADAIYACFEQTHAHAEIGPEEFDFELYGSREYSRLLEQEWGGATDAS
ncbi:MAG: hypothetical protein ACE15B_10025 [Bryobacteraceae bacterium]